MQRLTIDPRPDWKSRMEDIGFQFHTLNGVYWNEGACYRLTAREVDELEDATNELQRLCRAAVTHVIDNNLFDRLHIPPAFAALARASWEQQAPSVYGRFDLVYDGTQAPKLLEYNADTPTALFEASVAQWYWLQDHAAHKDQFNAIHERLLARWQEIGARLPRGETVYFACLQDNVEDYVTTEYLRDTAQQAGLPTSAIDVEDIGYDTQEKVFVDTEDRAIGTLFKLYPWEWLMQEDFAPQLLTQSWRLLEPAWKMLLSNKGILPILWELFPDHPNLLPAYFEPGPLGATYVQKPLLSREGANVTIRSSDGVLASPGDYGQEGWIYQAHCPLPVYDGNHAVIGSWIIGETAAGIGIREDDGPITRNTSRFVPHYFDQEVSC